MSFDLHWDSTPWSPREIGHKEKKSAKCGWLLEFGNTYTTNNPLQEIIVSTFQHLMTISCIAAAMRKQLQIDIPIDSNRLNDVYHLI